MKLYLLLEWESAILIRVEEADKTVSLRLWNREVALVTEEVEELDGADKSVAVSVKSLESGVRCEVTDGGETLAGGLKASLSVADCDEQLLKSTLRLKSKAHCV